MRLIVTLLAVFVTDILGMVVFNFPAIPFCVSILPLCFVAGYLAQEEKQ